LHNRSGCHDEDDDAEAEGREVQVLLRRARVDDVPLLHRQVVTSSSVIRPSSIRKAARSLLRSDRITYGLRSHRPMFSTSVRDGRGGEAMCEWNTASS